MRIHPSNPVVHGLEGRPFQMAEQPLWYRDFNRDYPPYSICGRCQTCFPAFDLEFSWGSNNPTKVTVNPDPLDETLPRPDWCYIFDSIRLTRQAIRRTGDNLTQVDPDGTPWHVPAGPMLAYTSCHWANQVRQLGSVRQVIAPDAPAGTAKTPTLNNIFNLQWFLFYGNSASCIFSPVPEVIADVDTNQIITEPLYFDSHVTGENIVNSGEFVRADFITVDEANQNLGFHLQGWTLALLKRQIVTPHNLPNEGHLYETFRPFAAYQLFRTEEERLREYDNLDRVAGPVFNCRADNKWEIAFNPIRLPPHTIRTIPAGP